MNHAAHIDAAIHHAHEASRKLRSATGQWSPYLKEALRQLEIAASYERDNPDRPDATASAEQCADK